LKLIESKHQKISTILKLVHQATEKQFFISFSKWSSTLRSTYFIFFSLQSSLMKIVHNQQQTRIFNSLFQTYRAKRTSARIRLWEAWLLGQWREQTYAAINNRYYWRRPRFYRELPYFLNKRWALRDHEDTLIVKRNRKLFIHSRRVAKYQAKKNRQKKEMRIKTITTFRHHTKMKISQKIKRMSRKNRIKSSANRIKKWISKRRPKIKNLLPKKEPHPRWQAAKLLQKKVNAKEKGNK